MIITITNHKGGTAKTETTMQLAKLLAASGRQVTCIDLDPQANLTTRIGALGNGHQNIGHVLGGVIQPSATIRTAAQTVDGGLRIVPATLDLENVAVGLTSRQFGRLTALRQALERTPLTDIVLIDTPPTLGVLTLNALVASTHVLVPSEPDGDSISGIQNILNTLAMIGAEMRIGPTFLGVVAVKVEENVNRHRIGLELLQRIYKDTMLAIIPKRIGADADAARRHAYTPVASAILTALRVEEGERCSA